MREPSPPPLIESHWLESLCKGDVTRTWKLEDGTGCVDVSALARRCRWLEQERLKREHPMTDRSTLEMTDADRAAWQRAMAMDLDDAARRLLRLEPEVERLRGENKQLYDDACTTLAQREAEVERLRLDLTRLSDVLDTYRTDLAKLRERQPMLEAAQAHNEHLREHGRSYNIPKFAAERDRLWDEWVLLTAAYRAATAPADPLEWWREQMHRVERDHDGEALTMGEWIDAILEDPEIAAALAQKGGAA